MSHRRAGAGCSRSRPGAGHLGVRWWRWARHDRAVAADGAEGAILVAYGSREGGTAEIAGLIAGTLSTAGVPADGRPAREVARLAPYRAVMLGGALYGNRWHPDARRFTRRHARDLRDRPVWLFASGPLAPVASPSAVSPAGQVMAAARSWARGIADQLLRARELARPPAPAAMGADHVCDDLSALVGLLGLDDDQGDDLQ
jgi:hypothetical protein